MQLPILLRRDPLHLVDLVEVVDVVEALVSVRL
jgi:hypothetical protein